MKKIGFFSFIALAVLSSCTKNSHPDYFGTVRPLHAADEFWTGCGGEAHSLDPNIVQDNLSHGMVDNMFIKLTESHAKTGEPVPELATRWNISDDGLTYTFFLRKDAYWSDGKPITAHDVDYSWKRLANPISYASYSHLVDLIKNGKAFREGAVQIRGLPSKQNAEAILKKLKSAASVTDIELDPQNQWLFAFLKSDDAAKKRESKKRLIEKINAGLLGSGITAKETPSEVMGLTVIDDHTFQVRLKNPVPYFLGVISHVVFAPLPRHAIEKFKPEGKEDQWTRPENIVVSGPFLLAEEKFKHYKIFKKNPKYFHADRVRLNKVKVLMIEDSNATLNAYRTGQHNFAYDGYIATDMLEKARQFKDYHHDPKLGTYYYQLNTSKKPFDDPRVRRALSLAIDRKTLVEKIIREGQNPTRDLVPSGMLGYKGPKSSIYEPEAAKKLLAQAGYPDGKGFPKRLLKFNTFEHHRKIAEAVQQMWKKNLGVHVDITNMEWASMIEDQNRKNFDLMRMAWIADYNDPHNFLSIFLSESKNNHTFWKNKKYDQLIARSDKTLDQEKRFSYFLEAEKIFIEETPVIPIYNYVVSYMKKPFVKGFWPHFKHRHPWKFIWIDERWYKGVPENPDIEGDEPWSN